jgi:hypothetical protein
VISPRGRRHLLGQCCRHQRERKSTTPWLISFLVWSVMRRGSPKQANSPRDGSVSLQGQHADEWLDATVLPMACRWTFWWRVGEFPRCCFLLVLSRVQFARSVSHYSPLLVFALSQHAGRQFRKVETKSRTLLVWGARSCPRRCLVVPLPACTGSRIPFRFNGILSEPGIAMKENCNSDDIWGVPSRIFFPLSGEKQIKRIAEEIPTVLERAQAAGASKNSSGGNESPPVLRGNTI